MSTTKEMIVSWEDQKRINEFSVVVARREEKTQQLAALSVCYD